MKTSHVNSPMLTAEKKAKGYIMARINDFMAYCLETNNALITNRQRVSFHQAHGQARQYFNSIHHGASLKAITDKIMFGRRYLEAMLPPPNTYYYKMLIKQYNAIVQFCINERHTRRVISSINMSEIV